MSLGPTCRTELARTCAIALISGALGCGSSSTNVNPPASVGGGGGNQAGGGASAGGSAGAGASTGGSSSGANSGAGAGGSGGIMVPPVKVPPVACDGLSAKVGVWEEISPPELLDVESFSVVVSPADGTVYAAGSNKTSQPGGPLSSSGVLRSSDCGSTFTRAHRADPGTPEGRLVTGTLWAMAINNTTPQILYVANGYGDNPTIYRSVDAGVTWKSLDAGVEFVQSIGIDRTNESHIAVTFHNDCPAPRKPWCFSTSTDGGDTWTMFDGPTGDGIGGWVEGAAIAVLGPKAYVVGSIAGIWYTGDAGATWKKVANDALYLTYSGGSTLVNGNFIHAGAGHVLVSRAAPDLDPPFDLAKGAMLDVIPNSPGSSAFVTAGDLVFGGNGQPDKQPFWTAPSDDIMKWTKMDQEICNAGGATCRGPAAMAYDPVHHVVYAANWGAGLWRYVIE